MGLDIDLAGGAPFHATRLAGHWGETGGTLGDKDKEIWVRTGKSRFQPWLGRDAATGVFSKGVLKRSGLFWLLREHPRTRLRRAFGQASVVFVVVFVVPGRSKAA